MKRSWVAIALLFATNALAQTSSPQVAGIQFSGDFRLRLDAAIRGASPQTDSLQNVRGRYRLRLNADKVLAEDLSFHMQLSTGAVSNGITFDQDFAGGVAHNPFMISEAYVDFHRAKRFSIRAGRQEEIFADNTRFLWDDDVRYNGFSERARFGPIEARAGQYFLINPNSTNVPAGSALTQAGLPAGTIARAAQMYHQGVVSEIAINANWKHKVTGDVHVYRNPNLVALTSNAAGAAAVVGPALGITVAGAAPGAGNATTASNNAILFARHYRIVRAAYRLEGPKFVWNTQVSRNVGTSQLRDAVSSSIAVGQVGKKGDLRGMYMFAIKDANSLLSQFTDDDLGTGVGVNIASHHIRLDYTIRPGINFQHLLFLQTERRSSNPAASFFVPLGRGTPRTWRYLGQIDFAF